MDRAVSGVLYTAVAASVEAMIADGTLAPGARIPSVRRMSVQARVSVSTVLQAYGLLEDRGVIEARPQSGYYVRADARLADEPAMTAPPRSPMPVGVHAMVREVLEAGHGGRTVVDFGAAYPGPDLVPLERLRRACNAAARRHPEALSGYALPPGREELRRQLARRVLDWGCRIAPSEFVVVNGCMEALNLCLRAVAKAGDVIALESPTYFGVLQIIESLGMKALEIPTHPREGISLDALEAALARSSVSACVLMPTIGNPLGGTMPDAAKKRAVRMLAERKVPLIEDAAYADLAFDAPHHAARAFDREGNVMLCGSFSKTLAPGFRLGWVAAGRWAERVRMLKFVQSVGTPELLQLAVAGIIESGGYDRLLRAQRRAYAGRIDRVARAVRDHFPSGTRVSRPGGGFVLWVELPAGADTPALNRAALREGIAFAPGPMFSASGRYANCLRLNCALPWSDATGPALARLGALAARAVGQARPRRR